MSIIQGDCLETMALLRDEGLQVQSVVTDPPYGLGKGKDTSYNAIRILSQVVFPNLDQLKSERFDNSDFLGIPVGVSNLDLVNRTIGIEPRVRMPEGSIDFYENFCVRDEEVDHRVVSSSFIPDDKLADKVDPESSEFLGDYILDLRDTWELAARNGKAGNFAQLGSGFVTVPVSAILDPSSPSPLSRLCAVILSSHSIREHDNTFGQPQGHSNAFTGNRAIDRFMLRFDLRRGSIDLLAASSTRQQDRFDFLAAPKIITTPSTASCLPTMFQPVRVSVIGTQTDTTRSFYFHLWVHKNWVRELSTIYSSGGFMGKDWDSALPDPEVWRLCYNLLAPGGHLVAFGGTRTYHRLCVAIEDAGFEIRDQLAWVYGTGLPKGLDVAKAILKAGGTSEQIAQFQGWNSTLKPAWEPIVLARKPTEGSVAHNMLAHGTGALHIDPNRIPIDESVDDPRLGGKGTWGTSLMAKNVYEGGYAGIRVGSSALGRYPANILHDGSDEVVELFGEANRFFYCSKANRSERRDSTHPTIKPVDLMRWLVRLVTPPGGVVLDPFAGTGTTGEAAQAEGFEFILIERDAEYVKDIKTRLNVTE